MRTGFLLTCATMTGLTVGLTGCVAALIPVAAGGAIGRNALHHRRAAAPDADRAAVAAAAPAAVPSHASGGLAPPIGVPAPIGGADAGPAVAGVAPALPAVSVPPPPIERPNEAWNGMLRHVAIWSGEGGDSVLLARHGAGAGRQWVSCEGKPEGVIVATAANPDGQGDSAIDALRTLHTAVIFTSVRPRADDPYFASPAPSHRLVKGDLFVQLAPGDEGAARARIGAHYCVSAIVGATPADFPDGIMPGTRTASPGWFAATAR